MKQASERISLPLNIAMWDTAEVLTAPLLIFGEDITRCSETTQHDFYLKNGQLKMTD